MLPIHLGLWQTVYWWFRRFVRRLLFRTIHDVALMLDRERTGCDTSPSGGVLDSQTVRAPFAKVRGYDGGKKVVVEVVRRCDPQSGFAVIPRRWVVDLTFAIPIHPAREGRRCSRTYPRPQSALARALT